jgi:hypothetical protein
LSWNGLLLARRAASGFLPWPLWSLVALALAAQLLALAFTLRRQASRPPGNAGLLLGKAFLGQRLLLGPLPLNLTRRHLVSRRCGALHLRRPLPALHFGRRLTPLHLRGRLGRPLWRLLDLGGRLLRRSLDLRRRLLGRRPLDLRRCLLLRRSLRRLLGRPCRALLPWRRSAWPAGGRLALGLVIIGLRHHQIGRREAVEREPSGHERRQHGAGQQQALCTRHKYPCSATNPKRWPGRLFRRA